MVQMQALACGLPLICTTNTGGEDLLKLSGNRGEQVELGVIEFPAGFLIPIHSPKAISQCLKEMNQNQKMWMSMRVESLRIASRKLSWKSYGARSIANYEMLIKRYQNGATSLSKEENRCADENSTNQQD